MSHSRRMISAENDCISIAREIRFAGGRSYNRRDYVEALRRDRWTTDLYFWARQRQISALRHDKVRAA